MEKEIEKKIFNPGCYYSSERGVKIGQDIQTFAIELGYPTAYTIRITFNPYYSKATNETIEWLNENTKIPENYKWGFNKNGDFGLWENTDGEVIDIFINKDNFSQVVNYKYLDHPERMDYELFLGNISIRDIHRCGWKTKRVGNIAYDISNKPIGYIFPIFVDINEILKEKLNTIKVFTRRGYI